MPEKDARTYSDRELLILTYEAVTGIKHDLYGNGQPGVLKDIEVLKAQVADLKGPSKTQTFGMASVASVFITAAFEFLKAKVH